MLEMLENLAREAGAGDAFACKDALVTDCSREGTGGRVSPCGKTAAPLNV